jgi:hypothetical protein
MILIKGFPDRTVLADQFDLQVIFERTTAFQEYIDKLLLLPDIENNSILMNFLDPYYMVRNRYFFVVIVLH